MRIFFIVFFTFLVYIVKAQYSSRPSNLSRNLSLTMKDQPLSKVLNKMSAAGNFYFSYSGDVIKSDPIVSISAENTSVKHVLSELLDDEVEFKESGKYIILRSVSQRFKVVSEVMGSGKEFYEIQGYVFDQVTGLRVKNASVYERTLLKTTLTDQDGFFSLHLKGEQKSISLTFSKENFRDTTLHFLQSVVINPSSNSSLTEGIVNQVERLWVSRFLVPSKQLIQSLNIGSVIANAPFQVSLLPGLSTHGALNSQVVNKGSVNVVGGYTAGVNGIEAAGVFNITKKDVINVQLAGALNMVGGSVNGLQAAGFVNIVLDSVKGVQAAGFTNFVNTELKGVQAAGLGNFVRNNVMGSQFAGLVNVTGRNVKGVQAAGLANFSGNSSEGAQLAGLGNITMRQLKGTQVGIFNYAQRINGTQIGLINVADTSSGYSIGLLNLVRKGYHKISLSTNEIMNANISIKTGNSKLYTILTAGAILFQNEKAFSTGLGMGHDFIFNKKFSIGAELTSQILHLGRKNETNILNRAQANAQFQIFKGVTLFAGPSFSFYYSDAPINAVNGYKVQIGPASRNNITKNIFGWPGFNFGLTFM